MMIELRRHRPFRTTFAALLLAALMAVPALTLSAAPAWAEGHCYDSQGC